MNLTHSQLIEGLGGVTAVAELLGIAPPSVSGWIQGGKDGIPGGRLIELGAEIEARLGVKRWKLRPHDWHRIWPELVGTKGAPQVPRAAIDVVARAPAKPHRERPMARAREAAGRAK